MCVYGWVGEKGKRTSSILGERSVGRIHKYIHIYIHIHTRHVLEIVSFIHPPRDFIGVVTRRPVAWVLCEGEEVPARGGAVSVCVFVCK